MNVAATESRTRVWCDLILETRIEFGRAARQNRSSYSGTKTHRLRCEYVVGVVDGYAPKPNTIGAKFVRTGRPELFSCSPCCGCTQGQHAGRPIAGWTESNVDCSKCQQSPRVSGSSNH